MDLDAESMVIWSPKNKPAMSHTKPVLCLLLCFKAEGKVVVQSPMTQERRGNKSRLE